MIEADFEKAKMGYEELLVIPQNMQYFLRVIDYQQLQQFNSAEKAIQARFEKYNQEAC
jgi:hypothetical protein